MLGTYLANSLEECHYYVWLLSENIFSSVLHHLDQLSETIEHKIVNQIILSKNNFYIISETS